MWVTEAVALSWGGFYVSQSRGTPVSLTGVRRTPIMVA